MSVISDLLNSSLGKLDSLNSATIATLSLRSLVSLCRAEVVDLKSVWNILAPKLNQDHRPTVVSEMCNLLALVAEIRVDNEEYDELTHQAIKTLFRVAMTSAPEVGILAIKFVVYFWNAWLLVNMIFYQVIESFSKEGFPLEMHA